MTDALHRTLVAVSVVSAPHPEQLTVRELEVVVRVAAGMSREDVGKDLGFSAKTFDTHRMHASQKIFGKVTFVSAAVWARWCVYHGLVDNDTGELTMAYSNALARAAVRADLSRGPHRREVTAADVDNEIARRAQLAQFERALTDAYGEDAS